MRWGVRDEMTNDHLTTELCLGELRACQHLSIGPNFVYFGGQKYGYRPLPTFIPTQELKQIKVGKMELATKFLTKYLITNFFIVSAFTIFYIVI